MSTLITRFALFLGAVLLLTTLVGGLEANVLDDASLRYPAAHN